MSHSILQRSRHLGAALALALMAVAGAAAADTATADPAIPAQSEVRAIFGATNAAGRSLPWVTDGTRAGTQPLRLGPEIGSPSDFADLGDWRVAFAAVQTRGFFRPLAYVSDGTREGTSLLALGAWSLAGFNRPTGFTPLGDGRFVFAFPARRIGADGHVQAIWVSDGTRAGTHPIHRWPQQKGTFHAHNFAQLSDGAVLFAMDDGRGLRGLELWFTDGTRDGTRLVRNLTGDAIGSGPRDLVQLADGLVLFQAHVGGWQLWASDGTRAGTRQLTTGGLPGQGLAISEITPIGGGQALFSTGELWRTDGTIAGTRMVFEQTDANRPRFARSFAALGDGRMLLSAEIGGLRHLMITDGTRAGTRTVQRFGSFTSTIEHTRSLGDGRAIFWRWQPVREHYALWVTDGTRQGTHIVQQFPGMTGSTVTDRLQEATTSLGDGRALFIANAPGSGRVGWIPDGPFEPWITDGTREGTRLLRNINRTSSSNPYGFTPFVPAVD